MTTYTEPTVGELFGLQNPCPFDLAIALSAYSGRIVIRDPRSPKKELETAYGGGLTSRPLQPLLGVRSRTQATSCLGGVCPGRARPPRRLAGSEGEAVSRAGPGREVLRASRGGSFGRFAGVSSSCPRRPPPLALQRRARPARALSGVSPDGLGRIPLGGAGLALPFNPNI